MTVKDAALQILRSAGEPLHAKEIAKRVIKAGLWQTTGKTPDATISARLYSDNRVGGGITSAVLPHHRTYGSVYGGSWQAPQPTRCIEQRYQSKTIKIGLRKCRVHV